MGCREEVVSFWDAEIGRWAHGERELGRELHRWLCAYDGRGEGAVDLGVFPEPYIGPLAGSATPALVMFGLNPGAAAPRFQGNDGLFTRQIATTSYGEWAGSAPYTAVSWESVQGRNKYHRDRLAFARRLHQRDEIQAHELLYMELYPFHSNRISAPIETPPDLLNQFVFGPVGELDVAHIFAFGKPWMRVAERLGLPGGRSLDVNWSAPSRQARSFRLPSGQSLVVLAQSGYAGPPGELDTARLSKVLRTI